MNLLYINLIKENNNINLVELEVAATVTKTVDKQIVNLEESFRYTINASFSGIEGAIASATIEDFIPEYITFTLPPIGGLLKNIREEDTTFGGQRGKKITFDFGSITDLGQAIALNLSCRFRFGTDSGTNFTNRVILNINGQPPTTVQAPTVTLRLNPDFDLIKEVVVPDRLGPSVGGILIYILTLKNKLRSRNEGTGDLGAKITNVRIRDTLPQGVTIDNSITSPTGSDVSRIDGRTNTLTVATNFNTINFTLAEYFGIEYKFIYAIKIPGNLSVGDLVRNNVTWTGDPPIPPKPPVINTTTVAIDNYMGDIIKRCPTHASVGNKISYNIFVRNSGNKDLTNIQIVDTISSEVTVNRINTGNFCIILAGIGFYLDSVNMTIDYEVNNSGTFINLGSYKANEVKIINLPVLSNGQKITKIRWTLPRLPVGYSNCEQFYIDGVINSNTSATEIINKVKLTANNNVSYEDECKTKIDGLSELRIIKEEVFPNTDVVGGQTIRYRLRVLADRSQIDNPIITDLLPLQVEYVGNELYKYFNYFDGENIEGNNSTFQVKGSRITVETIPNFSGARTLIRYKFPNGFKLEQRGTFSVEFDVKVKSGFTGEIVNTGILGNTGKKGVVDETNLLSGSKKYRDSDDRDGDRVTEEDLLESNEVRNNILVTMSLASDKKVKGPLDVNFIEEPSIGNTFPGGVLEYKLTVANTGNLPLNTIELIDILPHIGDTGVIDTSSRGSNFRLFEVSSVTAQVSPPRSQAPNLTIEYSTSDDPVRFDKQGNRIGAINNWSTIQPIPIINNRAFKITSFDLNLNPGESLTITVKCATPVGVPMELVAWNSFALRGTYIENGQTQNLLPVEPEKVGVKVKAVDGGKVKIGDFVWHDLNGNGIQDSNEPGINGVEVRLYRNCTGSPIATTFTTNNFQNKPGFYLFDNLDTGSYCVEFVKPNGFEFTIKNSGSDITRNSKVNENTGKTDSIILSVGQENLNMDAGLVQLAKVGDTVWIDLNEDGIKDRNEVGLGGVRVNLYHCTDIGQINVKYTATTNTNGLYLINVKPGSYFAVFSKPLGYRFITAGRLVDVNGKSECFTLQSGGENLNVDAPLIDEKDIKTTKSVDKTEAEIGEELMYTITITNKGILPVKNVELRDRVPNETTFIPNSITIDGVAKNNINLNNNLNIGEIQPNQTVVVTFKVIIKETMPIPQRVENKATIIFEGGEEEPPIVVTDIVKSSIGDFVWHDLNGDGIQQPNEPGVQGVTVRLYRANNLNNAIKTVVTSSSGNYLFNNLKAGNYIVEFEKPVGFNFTIKDAGSDNTRNSKVIQSTGRTDNITLGKNEEKLVIDAGLIDIKEIRTTKSVDKTEAEIGEEITYTIKITNNGVGKVENVTLIDRLPQGTTFVANSIIVDGNVRNGSTLDNNINIGDILPNVTSIVIFKVKINETGVIVTQVTNEARITFDGGGENPPPVVTDVVKSSIGDFVWYDSNGNGIQDASETGIQNVTVRLYESNNLNNALRTAVTDSRGIYLFDNLKSGSYIVEFVKPDGYNFTIKGAGQDTSKNSKADVSTGFTDTIVLNKNEEKLTIDAGLIDIKDVKTKKAVDKRRAEIGEELTYTIEFINDGIESVRNVRLIDRIPEGTLFIANSITVRGRRVADVDLGTGLNIGEIQSKEIIEVTFKVKINDSGFIPKTVTNKATITFDGGTEEPPIVITDVVKSSIGDFVWHDLNGNGLQDSDEAGIQGVTINLYQSNNLNNAIKTVVTGSRGEYLFDNLKSGDYIIKFVKPVGFNFTIKDVQQDINRNSKSNISTGLTDNIILGKDENKLNIDAGLIQPITIGDTVWLDRNEDSVKDVSEPGIQGVIVNLYDCKDTTQTIVKYTATTGANGLYFITNVTPGSYYAKFIKPQGYNFVTTVGLVDSEGKGKCFSVKSGDIKLDVDAPLIDIKNIHVDKTVDLNTTQIGDELVYTVKIINNGVAPLLNVKMFDDIPPGTTFISGSVVVNNTPRSSDNPQSGILIGTIQPNQISTITFKVKIGDVLPIPNPIVNKARITFTGGDKETPPVITEVVKSSIGDFIWHDLNGNGIQDAGEPGINGVTIKLYKASDLNNAIKTEVTKGNGKYLFDNLRADNYIVEFIKPIGYNFTIKEAGTDNRKNSKVNISTGKTDNIFLGRGIDNLIIDTGLIQPITIGDTAWLDRNEDGIQQPDEIGIRNILVTLYNCVDDRPTQYTAITDSRGKYLITNVIPGRYYAIFTKPAGYNFVMVGGLVDVNGRGKCFEIKSGQQNLFVDVPLIDIKNVDVDKTVNFTIAEIGDELLYTITIVNKGVAPIVNVRMIDPIPNGTVFVNGSVEVNLIKRPNDNPQNGILIGVMEPNERSTVTFKVKIGNVLPNPNPIVNKARIIFVGGDKETPEVETEVVKSSIGDFVWEDLNGDGIQDNGEPGIGNVRVNLYLSNNLTTSIRNTRTNLSGKYLFDNLKSGTYVLEFIKPDNTEFTIKNAGFNDNINSKVNILTGRTDNIELRRNETILNIDAGIIKLATVGDKAWLDLNEDGIEDSREPGVGGVRITLYDCITDTQTKYTSITDSNGMYLIKGVSPGSYYGVFVPRPGYGFVTAGGFVDENGKTQCFTIKSGEEKLDLDVPLKKIPCVIETCICGKIIDKCTCLGIECIEVFLMKANVVILKTTTDCLGMYCFKITIPGMYKIVFSTICCGYYITPKVLKINVECGKSICDLLTVVCMSKLPEKHCKMVCVEQPYCNCEKCVKKNC